VNSDASKISGAEYWRQLQNKKIAVSIKENAVVYTGKLLYIGSDRSNNDNNDIVNSLLPDSPPIVSSRYPINSYGDASAPFRFLLVSTENGLVYIELSQVKTITVQEPVSMQKKIPVMIFNVGNVPEKKSEGTISLFYMTKGMTWTPGYRIDISDPKTLTIEQSAVIVNELASLENADISLINGFLRVEFENVLSPLAPNTTLVGYFAQLANAANPGNNRNHGVMTQQAIISNNFGGYNDYSSSSLPNVPQQLSANGGPDTYYHSIGRKNVEVGSRTSLVIDKGSAEYQRFMECKITESTILGVLFFS
jgi:hypothetical protein